jgi:tryptophan synthase alpha chain
LRALERGTTPDGILADLSRIDVGVPLVVMTYYNLIFRAGHDRIAGLMAESGVSGAIIPDLPLEELDPWSGRPITPTWPPSCWWPRPRRPDRIGPSARSRGFVYAVGRMGVTGERAELAESARQVASGCSGPPTCRCAWGSASPPRSRPSAVCEVADGVVVGSALVRRLLEGEGPDGAADFVSSLRRALDAHCPSPGYRPGWRVPRHIRDTDERAFRVERPHSRPGRTRPGRGHGRTGAPLRCRCSSRRRMSSRRSWRSPKVIGVGLVGESHGGPVAVEVDRALRQITPTSRAMRSPCRSVK